MPQRTLPLQPIFVAFVGFYLQYWVRLRSMLRLLLLLLLLLKQHLVGGDHLAGTRVHRANDLVLAGLGLRADRHQTDGVVFLRGPRRRHVVHHDTSVAHRRLQRHRVAGPRVDVVAGASVYDAFRHRLHTKYQTTQVR